MRVRPPGLSEATGTPIFTDRLGQSEAFRSALHSFRGLLDSDTDVGTERLNVLTFYGMGGIGKTELSRRLEAWVAGQLDVAVEWGPKPDVRVAAAARIDLHGSSGQLDVLNAVLALRSAAARLQRRWPVFDLAFAAYWSAVRPGESLPALRGHAEFSEAVLETVGDIISDLGSIAEVTGVGTGTGVGLKSVQRLAALIRRRRDTKLALSSFDGFEGFLLRCAEEPSPTNSAYELLTDMAGLLSWELSRLSPAPLVVVFVDTFERLTIDPRRVAESNLNRLVYNVPNVLFVVTGRDRLTWADGARSELSHRGPWIWPGLSDGALIATRQFDVDNLSPHDSRVVLQHSREQLELPISDEVIEAVVVASGGLPQYLELVRQVAVMIKSAGGARQVTTDDVTGSLGSLVQRVLDDLPPDERRAIRAAALFKSFDERLLAAAAGVDIGAAERAVRRSMVDEVPTDQFSWRIHDAIREALRTGRHQGDEAWAEGDWQLAASRAASELRTRHDDAKNAGANRDVLDCLGLVIFLVCEQDVRLGADDAATYVDWLSKAIVYAPSVQGLRTRVPAVSKTNYGRSVLDFIRAKCTETASEEKLVLLRRIFDSTHPLALPAGRHLGYTYRLLREWDAALGVFDEVIARSPTPLNRGQRPLTLSLARRFVDADEASVGLSAGASVSRMAAYAHGLPARYFGEVDAKLAKLQGQGRLREVIEERGDLILRRSFLRPDGLNDAQLDDFLDEAEAAGHHLATRSALAAIAIGRGTAQNPVPDVLPLLDDLELAGYEGLIGFRFAFAEFCDALLATDAVERLDRLTDRISAVPRRTRSWIPVECFLASTGRTLSAVPTQWLEPIETVRARWRAHLINYLSRHVADPEDLMRHVAV